MDSIARAALARQLDAAPRPTAPAEPAITGPTTAQILGAAYRDAVRNARPFIPPSARLTLALAAAARRERAAAAYGA